MIKLPSGSERRSSQLLRVLSKAHVLADMPSLVAFLQVQGPRRVQTVNLHHLAIALRSPEFLLTIERADALVADGWPVVVLMRLMGRKVQRVTGADLVESLGPRGHVSRIALLGATEEVGKLFRNRLRQADIDLVFVDHGDARFWEPNSLARAIDDSGASITLVAVTPPRGEYIAEGIRQATRASAILAVGGAIDMATGARVRAPKWIQQLSLEWAFRLVQEPRRLSARYILECVPAAAVLLFEIAIHSLKSGSRS